MIMLKIGERAPDFSLSDQQGNTRSLADYRGRKLLVYFYPRADTPGCTRQSCAIRDAQEDLSGLKVAAVGISPDTPERQKKFDDKYSLGFTLLADPERQAAEAYGVWKKRTSYGRSFMGINRSSFLIDENGSLQAVWYGVKPEATVSNVTDLLND